MGMLMSRDRIVVGIFAFLCALSGSLTLTTSSSAQSATDPTKDSSGVRLASTSGVRERTSDIMQRQALAPPPGPRPEHELEYPDRDNLPQNPDAPATASTPANAPLFSGPSATRNIHTTANSFDGPTLTDTGAFPPDSMGTVGPTQYIVFVNGRIRSYTKGGTADGVLNADPDVFFASVTTPVGGSVVIDFTSDPQIRYDRFTARWYMSIIDVPCTNATCTATAANRWLLAVSDAASGGTISGSTVWTFFKVQADPGTNFCDYPSLGIDVNALYFGCNMFSSAGSFVGTNGYVVQKTSVQAAGPMVVTMFANLAAGTGAGPESPRGVDNFDPTATSGYFVGPDNATFSTIMFRRVTNPGSLTPTISANISVTVPTTTTPNTVEHAGNTGGTNGKLDSLDDRFFQAMIRNGHLWAAHNFRVSTAGVANTAAQSRNASRWYEFDNLATTPTVLQSGTVFDNVATRAASRQYFIPTIVATGQDHAVLGFTMAGVVGATPAYVGRLSGDTLGTMTGPPTTSVVSFGTTTANYNPPSDPGGTGGRRWGDYSFTVVDPLDDMSVWTIQEYNQALNSYAVRVAQLKAPPPATPNCSATPINFPAGTGNVSITATSTGGSGFYDPGTNLPAPALPFSHISATMTNGTVNSVTYNNPTSVTLNITANTAGLQGVTITNPDGQNVIANGCINVTGGAASKLKFTTQPTSGTAGQTLASVKVSVEDSGGNVVTTDNTTQVTLVLSSNTLNGTLTKTAVSGVATFSDLSIDTAGTGYTLTASSTPVLTGDTSTSFDIAAAAANKLAFAQQPTDAVAGVAISPAITVQVLDQFNNVVTSDTSPVTLAIGTNAGGSTLSGTATHNAIAGVATFNDLSLNKTGTGYTLTASDGALTGAISSTFNIAAGAAAKLAFVVQPSSATANVAIAPAVTVQVQDALGNPVAASGVTITLAANGPGSIFSGNSSSTDGTGLATFNAIVIQTAGNYTLTASATGLTDGTSGPFTISPGAATHLAFTQQPSNTTAGQHITPAVAVAFEDAFNNIVTSSTAQITLAIGNNAGGAGTTLSGGGAVAAVAGVATFTNASINKTGVGFTLTAASTGFTTITSATFNIVAGPAAKLAFTTQPANNANVGAGVVIPLVVQVQDALGNVVPGDTSTVSLALSTNPTAATLNGTTSVVAVNGIATFTDINITVLGTGYKLTASDSSGSVTSIAGNAFNIVPGPADHLAFLQQPTAIVAGAIVTPAVTVQVFDAFGHLLTTSVNVVNLSIASGPPATLFGGGSLNDSAGVVTYNALSIHVAGTYTLSATSTGLTGATSDPFVVSPGALHHLVFSTQPPASSTAGVGFDVGVTEQDQYNNVLTNDSATSVNLALAANPGSDAYAGASTTANAGVATFSGVTLTAAAGGYTLQATAGAKNVISTPFAIVPAVPFALAFVQQPSDVPQGTSLGSVSVQIQDAFGNRETSDSVSSVDISIALCGGPIDLGSVSAANGLATFATPGNGLMFYTMLPGLQLSASSGALSGTSQSFSVIANGDFVFADGFESCRP